MIGRLCVDAETSGAVAHAVIENAVRAVLFIGKHQHGLIVIRHGVDVPVFKKCFQPCGRRVIYDGPRLLRDIRVDQLRAECLQQLRNVVVIRQIHNGEDRDVADQILGNTLFRQKLWVQIAVLQRNRQALEALPERGIVIEVAVLALLRRICRYSGAHSFSSTTRSRI